MPIEFATDDPAPTNELDLTLSLSLPMPNNKTEQDFDREKLEEDEATTVNNQEKPTSLRLCGSKRKYTRRLLSDKKCRRGRMSSDGDEWKIKKVLTLSDVNGNDRLMLYHKDVENHILSSLTDESKVELCRSRFGGEFEVLDDNDGSIHHLRLKRHTQSSGSFVFIDQWMKNFIKRKGLEKGDTIGITCVSNDKILLKLLSKANN